MAALVPFHRKHNRQYPGPVLPTSSWLTPNVLTYSTATSLTFLQGEIKVSRHFKTWMIAKNFFSWCKKIKIITWSENWLKCFSLQSAPNSPAMTFSICRTGMKSADSRTRSKIRDSSGLIRDSSWKFFCRIKQTEQKREAPKYPEIK